MRALFNFVAEDFFPKTPSPKPARIPPQTPPAGGKSAEAERIHIPSQLFRPAESILILLEKGSRKVYDYSTNKELKGFFEAKMRDARSASQGFPPNFPNEFRIFGALARTDFSPRSRCEIRSNFDS